MKIRTSLLGISTVLCLVAGLAAQEPPPPPEPPRGVEGQPPTRPPEPPPVQRLETGKGNTWFEHTNLWMGDFLNKEEVKGEFPFENPTGKVITWRDLSGSCQCVRAEIFVGKRKFELRKKPIDNSLFQIEKDDAGKEVARRVTELQVQPGEKGKVVVHMEIGKLQGFKEATLQITSDDPDMKQAILRWQARGVELFTITPRDVFLNNMQWKDQKKFSFVVSSSVNPKFKLLDHDKLPPYVTVSKTQITQPDGTPAWKVEGTFGPKADPGAGGATIKFKTDWEDKEVVMTVVAQVTGPITVMPGSFLSFKKIRRGEGSEQKVTFTPNGDFELNMTNVEFPKLNFDQKYITAIADHVGKDLIVTVKISPEIKGTVLLRGSMIVHLDHPAAKRVKFDFNGILR